MPSRVGCGSARPGSGSCSRPITWRIESRLSRPTTSARASASSARAGIGGQGPPGAGEVQHHDRQRVGDDVVHLAGDARPLGRRDLLHLAVAHRRDLGGQCGLATQQPARQPGDADAAGEVDDPGLVHRALLDRVVEDGEPRRRRARSRAATSSSTCSVSHTITRISGNMPPGLLPTDTISTPGGHGEDEEQPRGTRTPPATSAHGTRPASAHTSVRGRNAPSSPVSVSRAATTAASDSSNVVDSARLDDLLLRHGPTIRTVVRGRSPDRGPVAPGPGAGRGADHGPMTRSRRGRTMASGATAAPRRRSQCSPDSDGSPSADTAWCCR